jgi:hypothetical protein
LNRFVDLDDILYGGDTIVGDIDMITSNIMDSIILKWYRLKFLWWMHYLQYSGVLNNGLGLFSVVGSSSLHHTQSLVYKFICIYNL